MGAACPSAGVAALNGSFVEFDGSGALGHDLSVATDGFPVEAWQTVRYSHKRPGRHR